jgi:S1-C subfamily serine protease
MRSRLGLLIGVLVASALVITAVISFRWGASDRPAVSATPRPSASAEGPLSVAQIFSTLAPSVVSIRTSDGSGTGVIVNADGTILTAYHVVEGADSIELAFADGTRSPGAILGADPANDIAVLTAENLPAVVVPAVLGGSGRLAVGDEVVAIGNQLGLSGSTTAGVVSGLGRSVSGKGGGDLHGLIQFDAAVNPGSSGGPLVNNRGEIVGIVVALANPTEAGTFIGVGFAVPIGTAIAGGGERRPQI